MTSLTMAFAIKKGRSRRIKKKNSYISNNFIVGDNLIETYESQSCPLDTRNVEKIIKTFLV